LRRFTDCGEAMRFVASLRIRLPIILLARFGRLS